MTAPLWEITVGNIGTVYAGNSWQEANATYLEYVRQSQRGIGRAGGESVVLWYRGEIRREHNGARKREEE
jgi:hypothetical protein